MRKTWLMIGIIMILTAPCVNINFELFMDAYAAEKAKKPSKKPDPAPAPAPSVVRKAAPPPAPAVKKVDEIIPSDLVDMEALYKIPSYGFKENGVHGVQSVQFSQDNRYLAITNSSYSSYVGIVDVGTYNLVKIVEENNSVRRHNTAVFDPTNHYLAIGSGGNWDNQASIFSVGNWEKIVTLKHEGRVQAGVNAVAFSPDAHYFVTGGGMGVRIFETATWKMLLEINQPSNVQTINFSPNGKLLTAGGGDKTTRIYNVGSWEKVAEIKPINPLYGYSSYIFVKSLSFSPDGRYVVIGYLEDSARYDYHSKGNVYLSLDTLRVYEVDTWKEVAVLKGHYSVKPVGFSPDGRLLIAGNSDISTNIFEVGTWNFIKRIDRFRVEAFNQNLLIGNQNEELVALDMNKLSLYLLDKDAKKLGYKDCINLMSTSLQQIETDFQTRMKTIESEGRDTITKLGGSSKDEFETEIEYKARLATREKKIIEINQDFVAKRSSLRRERANKNVQLVDRYEKEINKLLIASRKPIKNLKPLLGTYIPDSETFSISINATGVVPLNDIVKVPRANARNFKDNIEKYQVSGEVQIDRTGEKKLLNVVINNQETGETYYLAKTVTGQEGQVAMLPPNLSASIKFEEPSGTKALNAEETGKLVIKIKNDGKGSAYQVIARPIPAAPISDLSYEAEKVIPEIGPGTEHEVIFPLKAGLDLPTKQVQFNVGFEEKNGLPPNPVKISFQTRAVLKPDLQIVDYAIDNAAKDGIIKPEEVVKMTFKVQNKGQGTGRNVVAKVALGNNVFPALNMPLEHGLGELKPNAVKEFTIAFYANQRVRAKLPLKVDLVEDRKRFNAEKQYALSMGVKEKTVFETVVSAKDLQAVRITDLEASSDLEQDIPSTGVINRNAVAVVIGNYDYKNVQKVSFARRDAVVMKEYLVKTFGYDPGNIIFLPDATLSDMLNALGSAGAAKRSKLSSYLRSGSEIFVYYTGHGAPGLQDKKGYLVPIDADPNNIETTGYSLETLYRNLESLNASKLTVVIDACFSGDSQAGMLFKDASPIMVQAKSDKLNTGTVITSSSGDQISSWYPEKKHSLFTYFFLKGIKDKATRKEPVAMQDLKVYVTDEVDRMSRRLYNRIQTPGFEGNLEDRLIE